MSCLHDLNLFLNLRVKYHCSVYGWGSRTFMEHLLLATRSGPCFKSIHTRTLIYLLGQVHFTGTQISTGQSCPWAGTLRLLGTSMSWLRWSHGSGRVCLPAVPTPTLLTWSTCSVYIRSKVTGWRRLDLTDLRKSQSFCGDPHPHPPPLIVMIIGFCLICFVVCLDCTNLFFLINRQFAGFPEEWRREQSATSKANWLFCSGKVPQSQCVYSCKDSLPQLHGKTVSGKMHSCWLFLCRGFEKKAFQSALAWR